MIHLVQTILIVVALQVQLVVANLPSTTDSVCPMLSEFLTFSYSPQNAMVPGLVKNWFFDATSTVAPVVSAATDHILPLTSTVTSTVCTATSASHSINTDYSAVPILSSAALSGNVAITAPVNYTTTIYLQYASNFTAIAPPETTSTASLSITIESAADLSTASISATDSPFSVTPLASTTTSKPVPDSTCSDCALTTVTVPPSHSSTTCTSTLTVTGVPTSATATPSPVPTSAAAQADRANFKLVLAFLYYAFAQIG